MVSLYGKLSDSINADGVNEILKIGSTHSDLVISALSRPLEVGMLYNAWSDRLVPGISLWKADDIQSKTQVSPQPYTTFKVAASETLSDKMSLLDVSASVKASFLGGLVKVSGSASYLNEKRTSAQQCSITLKYHVTTVFKELMITELETPNTEVFDGTDATHVVSGVLYGADAFMEFQQTARDYSERQEVEGNLNAMINKIPTLAISGEASLRLNSADKQRVKNFKCRFYGDTQLKKLPSTFEEAVEVYKELPSLLGEAGEKVVPVKVWLYPLSKLINTKLKLKRAISETLVAIAEKAIDDFQQAKIRTNDLLKGSREIKAEDIITKLEQFQRSLSVFTVEFLRKMAVLIPAIRAGNAEETALRDLLMSQDASGFSGKEMEQWLDGKETEINIVTMYRKLLPGLTKTPGPELNTFLMDPKVKDVFIFSFTSLNYKELYLQKTSQAAENFRSGSNGSSPIQNTTEDAPWYMRPDIKKILLSTIDVFKITPTKKAISFISDSKYPGASVQWYHNAVLKNPHVTSFSSVGGVDVKRVTWNILASIFSCSVARRINWKGVNEKMAFKKMASKVILTRAVRNCATTAQATDDEICHHAIRWFSLAHDRFGGRQERMERQRREQERMERQRREQERHRPAPRQRPNSTACLTPRQRPNSTACLTAEAAVQQQLQHFQ
ncbi:verrucotoxin subunit beta-like [Alosa pseudoharengus]|uniref:verrucotoxin subunit beta-like n=1 Tax=Alosa pseudoharengus TaxID=34774 RepID=UPI003F895413